MSSTAHESELLELQVYLKNNYFFFEGFSLTFFFFALTTKTTMTITTTITTTIKAITDKIAIITNLLKLLSVFLSSSSDSLYAYIS